jgi:hypothetical protein
MIHRRALECIERAVAMRERLGETTALTPAGGLHGYASSEIVASLRADSRRIAMTEAQRRLFAKIAALQRLRDRRTFGRLGGVPTRSGNFPTPRRISQSPVALDRIPRSAIRGIGFALWSIE